MHSKPRAISNPSNPFRFWYLNLAFNQLTSLPAEIGGLSNLEYLYLEGNTFTDETATESIFSSLKSLVELKRPDY